MSHNIIYSKFEEIFSNADVENWWPCGYMTIRIRYVNKEEVVFMYRSNSEWTILGLDDFISNLLGLEVIGCDKN